MEKKVDGIVITTRSLKCLPLSASSMYIKYPLRAEIAKSSWLKGSVISQNEVVTRISLTNYFGLEVHLVFQSEDRIDFTNLLSNVYKSIEDSLADERMCQSETTVRRRQTGGSSSANVAVFIGDIDIFGELFYKNVNTRLPAYNPLFVLHKFGHSASFAVMTSILSSVRSTEDIQEFILHVAYDIAASENCFLLWDRSAVFEKMAVAKSIEAFEYYVCGIPGYGNFTFQQPRQLQVPILGSGKLKKVQLYASIAKYLHSQQDPPFAKPMITNNLLRQTLSSSNESGFFDCDKGFTKSFTDIKCIHDFINNIPYERHYARCEFIINHPVTGTMNETVQAVSALSDSFLQQIQPSVCYQEFTTPTLSRLFEKTVRPCLDTIYEQVLLAYNATIENTMYRLKYDTYVTLLACEAIVCFMIRGTATSTSSKARHDNNLLKLLKLNSKEYEDYWTRSEYMIDTFGPLVRVENDKVHVSLPNTYIPFHLFKLRLSHGYTYTNLVDDIGHEDKLSRAAYVVANWILSCTINNLGRQRQDSTDPIIITHRLKRQCTNILIGSGSEILKRLETSFCSSILWILQECQRLSTTSNLLLPWKHALAKALEECGFNSRQFVCFEYGGNNENCQVVLPFLCLNSNNFLLAIPIWLTVISDVFADRSGSYDEDLIAAKIELLIQRSMEGLTFSEMFNIDVQDMLRQLFSGEDLQEIRSLSNTYNMLFAEPFPI